MEQVIALQSLPVDSLPSGQETGQTDEIRISESSLFLCGPLPSEFSVFGCL